MGSSATCFAVTTGQPSPPATAAIPFLTTVATAAIRVRLTQMDVPAPVIRPDVQAHRTPTVAMVAMVATGIHSGTAFAVGSMEMAVVGDAAAVVAVDPAAMEPRCTITPHRARVEEWVTSPIRLTQWLLQQ